MPQPVVHRAEFTPTGAGDDDEEDEPDDGAHDSDDDPQNTHERAARNSGGRREPSSKTMAYYGSTWKSTLEKAKLDFDRYMSLEDPFPTRKDLPQVSSMLRKRIQENIREGHYMAGKCLFGILGIQSF